MTYSEEELHAYIRRVDDEWRERSRIVAVVTAGGHRLKVTRVEVTRAGTTVVVFDPAAVCDATAGR